MTLEEFLLVNAKIKRELENISLLENELASYKLFPVIKANSLGGFHLEDNAACRIIGSILHDYYVAVENIFKAVARRIDGVELPATSSYFKRDLSSFVKKMEQLLFRHDQS